MKIAVNLRVPNWRVFQIPMKYVSFFFSAQPNIWSSARSRLTWKIHILQYSLVLWAVWVCGRLMRSEDYTRFLNSIPTCAERRPTCTYQRGFCFKRAKIQDGYSSTSREGYVTSKGSTQHSPEATPEFAHFCSLPLYRTSLYLWGRESQGKKKLTNFANAASDHLSNEYSSTWKLPHRASSTVHLLNQLSAHSRKLAGSWTTIGGRWNYSTRDNQEWIGYDYAYRIDAPVDVVRSSCLRKKMIETYGMKGAPRGAPYSL